MSEWQNIPDNIEPYEGFVYLITELDTGMKYIGCKKFWHIDKKKPGKFKKTNTGEFLYGKDGKRVLETRTIRRCTRVETNWRTYKTSNDIMSENIKNNPSNYTKEIIRCCSSVSEMKGYEAYLQLQYYFTGRWHELYNKVVNVRMVMTEPGSEGTNDTRPKS